MSAQRQAPVGVGIIGATISLGSMLVGGVCWLIVGAAAGLVRSARHPAARGHRRWLALGWALTLTIGIPMFAPRVIGSTAWQALALASVAGLAIAWLSRVRTWRARRAIPPPPTGGDLVIRGDYDDNAKTFELEVAIGDLVWAVAPHVHPDLFVAALTNGPAMSTRLWVRSVVDRNLAAWQARDRGEGLDGRQGEAVAWLFQVSEGMHRRPVSAGRGRG